MNDPQTQQDSVVSGPDPLGPSPTLPRHAPYQERLRKVKKTKEEQTKDVVTVVQHVVQLEELVARFQADTKELFAKEDLTAEMISKAGFGSNGFNTFSAVMSLKEAFQNPKTRDGFKDMKRLDQYRSFVSRIEKLEKIMEDIRKDTTPTMVKFFGDSATKVTL